MATGTGTGTPATGTTLTLATLRNRLRTQLMNASGFPEPLNLEASSETLTTLRDRVETMLQDTGNATWDSGDIDEAIEQTVEQWSRKDPQLLVTSVTLTADGREVDISGISNPMRIERVWWPYDSSNPDYPPNWVQFEVWPGDILYIDEPTAPTTGDKVRIWYTKMHTLNGLNSATATTLLAEDMSYIISGAAAIAARMRAVELAEELTVHRDVVDNLNKWADEHEKTFRYGMNLKQPAWQRYGYAYDQNDLDEAIAWALGRYNEQNPEIVITTITLSSDGREIDISSITDYTDILQVWWDYDSSDPEYPPKWRNFQLWPGDILYLNTSTVPQSGDVVRIWYKRLRTINGLNSASTTTLPSEDEELVLTGASGFSAQQRVQDQPGRYVPRKIAEWADDRLREFERGLRALATRQAAKHSGTAQLPTIDRWDSGDDGW
jgi:rRNA-processing protein FCF1